MSTLYCHSDMSTLYCHSDMSTLYCHSDMSTLYYSSSKTFVFSTLGFTAVTFSTGALAQWAPTFVVRISTIVESGHQYNQQTCVLGCCGVCVDEQASICVRAEHVYLLFVCVYMCVSLYVCVYMLFACVYMCVSCVYICVYLVCVCIYVCAIGQE